MRWNTQILRSISGHEKRDSRLIRHNFSFLAYISRTHLGRTRVNLKLDVIIKIPGRAEKNTSINLILSEHNVAPIGLPDHVYIIARSMVIWQEARPAKCIARAYLFVQNQTA